MSPRTNVAHRIDTCEGAADERSRPDAHVWRPGVLLLTELYPPAVGGTPVLFESVYSRLPQTPVIVLADNKIEPSMPARVKSQPPVTIVRKPLATKHWGVLDAHGLRHHLFVAREARKLGSRREVIV